MQIIMRNGYAIKAYVLLAQLVTIFYCSYELAYCEEQKMKVLFERQSNNPITSSVIDINGNTINDFVISEDGYLHIYEWTGFKFEEKWLSSQYSYVLPGSVDGRIKSMTVNYVSTVFPVQFTAGTTSKRSFFYYTHPVPKKTDMYELSFSKGNYCAQKRLEMLSSVWSAQIICNDQTTLLGSNPARGIDYMAAYAWNGKEIIEKWSGLPGRKGVLPGQLYITPTRKKQIALLLGLESSILFCENGQYHTKEVGKIETPFPGYNDGHSMVGITKKESLGEIWTIETPKQETSPFYKLYISIFNGSEFSRFNKVNIKGINTDMVSTISLIDIDDDGVDEIIGSEVVGKVILSTESENPEIKDERSYIFAAKWNGKEYIVMWRRRAADATLQRIFTADVTGDGIKEIIAEGYSFAKNVHTLFVLKMVGESDLKSIAER